MINYILINDFYNVLTKWKILISWLLIILIYPFFLRLSLNYDFDNIKSLYIFFSNIGSLSSLNSIIDFSMLMLNLGIFCYISVFLFTLNVEFNKEFVYLRIPYRKWLISKIISVFIIVSIICFIETLLLLLVYVILGLNLSLSMIFYIIFYNIVSKLILVIINLLLFQFNKKFSSIIVLILYTICAIYRDNSLIGKVSILIFNCHYNNLIPILFLIFLLAILYTVNSKKMYQMFRRG